jgi:hypothetical protein
MAAIDWLKVEGFEFAPEEAREASDFVEILRNFDKDPAECFGMFRCEDLSVGRRLIFAAKASDDDVAFMLLRETDSRLIGLIRRRLDNARLKDHGGIVF